MISLTKELKKLVRPLPGALWFYINLMMFMAYLKYQIQIDDDCRIQDKWDFEHPSDAERQQAALDLVAAQMGDADWGEVIEVGCDIGVFTRKLGNWSRSLTACDVSAQSCRLASERCADLPNVKVHQLNILKDEVAGRYDMVFIMGTLSYFKGRARLSRVMEKLTGALRDGGFLLFQEMRLPPMVESSLWVRFLCEGGLQIRSLFDRRPGLKLISDRLDADYVTVLYQKDDLLHTSSSSGWKRLVPHPLKAAYRDSRVVLKSLNELDFTSAKHFFDSSRSVRSILKVYKYSLITPLGLTQLIKLVRELDTSGVQGDFVECGVYRGGSAALLGMALNSSPLKRELWLFDSFQGLPAADTVDGPSAAALGRKLVSDSEDVRRLLNKCGVPECKSHIFPGWFNETLSSAPIRQVALLHLDADWYASTKQCLEHFYDLVSPGGVIVLDDYVEWPGCKAALDEFAAKRSLQIKFEGGGETPVYFRKTQ